jgi:hypothetical protein
VGIRRSECSESLMLLPMPCDLAMRWGSAWGHSGSGMRSQWQPANLVARLVDLPCADRYVFEHSLGSDAATLTCCESLFGGVTSFPMLSITALLIR